MHTARTCILFETQITDQIRPQRQPSQPGKSISGNKHIFGDEPVCETRELKVHVAVPALFRLRAWPSRSRMLMEKEDGAGGTPSKVVSILPKILQSL